MKPSIVAKLEALQERYEEIQALLAEADVIASQERFRALSKEYAQLTDGGFSSSTYFVRGTEM